MSADPAPPRRFRQFLLTIEESGATLAEQLEVSVGAGERVVMLERRTMVTVAASGPSDLTIHYLAVVEDARFP